MSTLMQPCVYVLQPVQCTAGVTEPQLDLPDAVVAEKPPDLLSAASKVRGL